MGATLNLVDEAARQLAQMRLGEDLTIVLPKGLSDESVRTFTFELSLKIEKSFVIIVNGNELMVYLSGGKGKMI